MRTTKQLLILLLAPLLSYNVLGQQAQVASPGAGQVQMLLSDEQVRLVHSQPYYAAGERLWYKAHLNKSSSQPLSKALYVELLNAQGQLIVRQRLVIDESIASGDILLPQHLPTGHYTLLARTNWMKNFSNKQQYREKLLIVNAGEVVALKDKAPFEASQKLAVQFFPESNSVVAGVPAKVAAVVTNAAGTGIAATGSIENEAGETVASFQTDDTGIGLLEFRPDPQAQYEALVQADGYLAQRAVLPKAKQHGLALSMEGQNEDELQIKVNNTTPWAHTLVAASGGKVYLVNQGKGSGTVTVPRQAKAGEPVRLLLLNPGGLAEAERLVLPPQSDARVSVSTEQQQYAPRQQVQVTLQVLDGQGAPLAADVAVSVAAFQTDFHMPLAKNPSFWADTLPDKLALIQAVDEGLWKGLVLGKLETKYQLEQLVDAFARDGVMEPMVASNYNARTDTAFVQALPQSVLSYALQHHNRVRINEVYGLAEPHAVAPIPKLPADKVFKLDDYVAFNSVEEAIREATTNLRLSKKKGKYVARLLYVRPGVKKLMKGEPIYLIDGVVVNSMEEILNLDLNDIASFELAWMEEKLYAGNLGHVAENGMLAVYTKSGEARERLKEKGYAMLYEQYNRPSAFVASPNAGAEAGSQTLTPDFRKLVFWEPQLKVGTDGKASFSFYTSDETGIFIVKVQGQTADGVPVSGEADFEVRLVK
ncbi:hypothetical protein [Pontibacter korlensis]|nr:hypothetical protein [Pontibacter korlensis]